MRRRTAIFGLAGLTLLAGCDRRQPSAAAPKAPATQVVTTQPAATQPAEEPKPAIFVINNQSFTFPTCKLVTAEKDGAMRVTLFSIDPPEAAHDGYAGNSFYFRFNLDSTDDLIGQQFVYRTSDSDEHDDTSGLFIAGGKQTLRPQDAVISFDKVDGQMIVTVSGAFRLYDEDQPPDTTALVKVRAMLVPVVAEAKK